MTALTLLDANGNPITCGTLDVAGDPTAFDGNPVVELQDDGTFALAEQVVASDGLIGPGTNIDWWVRSGNKRQSFILVGAGSRATTIDGVRYDALGTAHYATDIELSLEGSDAFETANGRGSESGVDFTVTSTPFEYYDAKPEELKLVALMGTADIGDWAGTSDATLTPLAFTHDVHLITFDSASGSDTAIVLDGAVISDTMLGVTERKRRSYYETAEYWEDATDMCVPGSSAQDFEEYVRYNFPFTVPAGKNWQLFSSNAKINGTPVADYPGLTLADLRYNVRVNLQG